MSEQMTVHQSTIGTRREAREVVTEAKECGCTKIDLGEVNFISRSVADELVHFAQDDEIQITSPSDEVGKMLEIVRQQASIPA